MFTEDSHVPGEILNGRYEIVNCIGKGSCGVVYKCRFEEKPGSYVAVKVLNPKLMEDRVAVSRFSNEFIACSNITHHNVLKAHEVFRQGALVGFSMEYVEGADLAEFMSRHPRAPFDVTLNIMQQVACGLEAVHQAGVIHRDLKPENILLSRTGHAKIADFGTARLTGGPKLTETGNVVGTLDYLCPEYLAHDTLDERADIYALGVIGYEMLTGEIPFRSDNLVDMLFAKKNREAEPVERLRTGCPRSLARIVMRALRRDPELRQQNASELLKELRAIEDYL